MCYLVLKPFHTHFRLYEVSAYIIAAELSIFLMSYSHALKKRSYSMHMTALVKYKKKTSKMCETQKTSARDIEANEAFNYHKPFAQAFSTLSS